MPAPVSTLKTQNKAEPLNPLDDQSVGQLLRRATTALVLGLAAPLLLLLVIIVLLLRSADWVDHTDRVIATVNESERLLMTMQTSFRGYRLADDRTYMQSYSQAQDRLMVTFKELESLVTDSTVQESRLAEIKVSMQTWFDFVDAELEKIRLGQSRANDPSFLRQGVPMFNAAIHQLETFRIQETALLAERVNVQGRFVNALFILLAAAALLGIPALTAWLQRLLRSVSTTFGASVRAAEHRASELQVTLESIGDAVVATDAQGRVDFLNPVAEALMGWTTREARGRELTEVFKIFNEDTGATVENPVDRVLRENIIVGLANHTVLRSRDGREVPIEDSAAPIRNAAGAVQGVILVFHDVSERKVVERRLRDSEWQLRFLNNLSYATRSLVDPGQIMETSTRLLGEYM